jgi:chemotaxis methyl-accepting protein methylase
VTSTARDPEFIALLERIHRDRGLECEAYKVNYFKRRIAVRMRACGVRTYDQYIGVLAADAGEYDHLLDALTINVTKFYRNAETWEYLRAHVLPTLWAERCGPMMCWSAGCASGEEPYTLAMLVCELEGGELATVDDALIDATDIDRTSLERARAGTFGMGVFDELPPSLTVRYTTGNDPRMVVERIRRLVRFSRHDLLRDEPPAPPYDLIMCRNVVIYLDRTTQERLFDRMCDALRTGGYLVLGRVETLVGDARDRLSLESARERVYRKK